MPDQNKEKLFEITVEPKGSKNNSYILKEKNLKNKTITEFIPLHGGSLSIYIPKLRFKIVNLTGGFSVGVGENGLISSNTDALVGKALLWGGIGDSISFFGSDKEIKNFEIKIKSVKSLALQGFGFYAYKPENINSEDYDLHFDQDDPEEETLYITIYLHSSKYKKIKFSLEKGFIKEIHCNIDLANEDNTSNIRGLYIADFCSIAPFNIYKILHSVDDIKNKADLQKILIIMLVMA